MSASNQPEDSGTDRREFASDLAAAGMVGGLTVSYGTLLAWAGRFLYSSGEGPKGWMFVSLADDIEVGGTLPYVSPTGHNIVIARHTIGSGVDDFIALSSVCPHLGCNVHWQSLEDRFFCPCHNGTFDPEGKATGGPPAAAGQTLSLYPLRIENGLLYIEVPLEGVSRGGKIAHAPAVQHDADTPSPPDPTGGVA